MTSEYELQKSKTILLFNQIKDDICLNKRGIFSYSEDDMCIYYQFKNPRKEEVGKKPRFLTEKGMIIYVPNKYDNEMDDCKDDFYMSDINETSEYEVWIKIGIVIDYGEHVYEKIKDVYSIIELKEELLLMTNEIELQEINDINNMIEEMDL